MGALLYILYQFVLDSIEIIDGYNLAEGSGRTSKIDFARFIQIAYGSMMELLNQLIIAEELEYIQKDELVKIREQIDQISIRLSGLRKSLLQPQP